jgi:uncharacterized GH25 family protein
MTSISLVCLAATWLPQEAPAAPSTHAVEVRITDSKGGPVQVARVRVIAPMRGTHRIVARQPERQLEPKDFPGDYARLDDLPAGRYVLLVCADHHAPTLSEPFEVPAATVPQVTVRLRKGAILEGVVTDPAGKPVASAEVTLAPGGRFADKNAPESVVRALVRTTTDATVRTAADGTFRVDHVADGEYRVAVRHDAFAMAGTPLAVAGEKAPKLPIALAAGTLVAGTVTRDGKPVEGAEVVLLTEIGSADNLTRGFEVVRLTAVTDANGAYRMPERAPLRGRYAVMASEPVAVRERTVQLQATRRVIVLKAGDAPQIEDLQLPPN